MHIRTLIPLLVALVRVGDALVRVCIVACFATTATAAVVENVRTYRSPEYTRLVFDLDTSLDHRIFTLDNPDRVVVDLSNSELRGEFDMLALVDTPISSIRSAARNDSDIRIVLDMRNKVQPRSFILAPNEQYGNRLVIDLYDVEGPDGKAPQKEIPSAPLETTKRDIIVAISAGHGGEDPGAIGFNRLREKNVTLAIAQEVEVLINSTPGFRAVMIRDGDYYVGLRQRIEMGHDNNADLYIAIHADAHSNKDASGSTIYALSQSGATSEQARRLAEKENSADLIGGVGSISLDDKDPMLRSVLLDLSITATIATSLEIGDRMIGALGNVTTMRRRNVEQAAFVELKSADIPSLLIETGYITNPADAKNLDSSAWRRRFASALVNGITGWFGERPPRGTLVAWLKENPDQKVAARSGNTYTVRPGDNLSELAAQFGTTLSALKNSNNLSSNVIRVGQVLSIPGSASASANIFIEHTISRGETLSHIANSYSVPMDLIRQTNALKGDTIRIGQVLRIPAS